MYRPNPYKQLIFILIYNPPQLPAKLYIDFTFFRLNIRPNLHSLFEVHWLHFVFQKLTVKCKMFRITDRSLAFGMGGFSDHILYSFRYYNWKITHLEIKNQSALITIWHIDALIWLKKSKNKSMACSIFLV